MSEPQHIRDILPSVMADIAARMDGYWEEQAAEHRRAKAQHRKDRVFGAAKGFMERRNAPVMAKPAAKQAPSPCK